MGFWRTLGRNIRTSVTGPMHTYSDPAPRPIDQVIMEMKGSAASAPVSRELALSVPAVTKGRNMLASIATLPLVQYDAKQKKIRNPLLEQLDKDIPNVVTLAMTIEDLLLDGISWWRIVGFGGEALFPTRIKHVDVSSVSLQPPSGPGNSSPLPSGYDPREAVVWVDGVRVPAAQMIRFDSPNPAVLKVGANAIRRAVLLNSAASMYADDPRPLDYFTPTDGADEVDDDEVQAILAKWRNARKKRSTAWVPQSMKYNTVDAPTPQQLQLVELQKQATLDIANALGIDPEELGISTTSRTYSNAVDRRRDRVNDVLMPYMRAITDRLSMGDVTPRGHKIAFDLDDYMRANPTERWNTYQVAFAIRDEEGRRAITVDEIREEEKMPPAIPNPEAAKPPALAPPQGVPDASGDPTPEPAQPVDAARTTAMAFAGEETLRTFDLPLRSFNVNRATRTIEGLALPYGVTGSKYGLTFQFLQGALKWNKGAVSRVKLLRDHDMGQPLGVAVKLTDGEAGLFVKFKVGTGRAGDEALALAAEGILDGLSVGVEFDVSTDVVMDDSDPDLMLVKRADLREVSLTAMPLFDDARVTSVAASKKDNKGATAMEDETGAGTAPATDKTPAQPTGLALSTDQLSTLLAHPGALQALTAPKVVEKPSTPPGGLQLSKDQLDAIIANGGLGALLGVPTLTPAQPAQATEQRETVDPTHNRNRVTASVTEPLPYRFDRDGNLTKGVTYDFSTDLIAGSRGDGEAMDRAHKFLQAMAPGFTRAQFATGVDVGDVVGLNPNRNRPDMYVDQQDFQYPIWDAISKGTLADITPFVLPKFATATGLVAAHVEGVEPTPGTFTATAQTITPSAVSGKVEITREAWDQGGNPQLSGIIWRQMTKAWFEALEASAVAMLDALTPTGITLTTAGSDDVLVGEMTAALAALQFVRGGMRMRDLFLQIDLYQKLIAAVDANGRKLLPLIGAVNADGNVSDLYADINIGGLRGRPGWALAATGTVAASSYLFDRNDVHGWATAPQRLQFEYRVSHVDVAIWGYKALANTDITGVREIIYDPA